MAKRFHDQRPSLYYLKLNQWVKSARIGNRDLRFMHGNNLDNPPTDYGAFVVKVVAQMTRDSKGIEQATLRHCIGLSSTHLVSDTSMNPERGLVTWFAGFNQLVEVIIALHAKGELELETMNAASKACSECWTVGGGWRGLEDSREYVRKVAAKLKNLLDEGGRTYKGERVYAP